MHSQLGSSIREGYCKPGWLKHEDHCYFFNERRETWMNARKMCEDNGASLASIRSSEENSWIVDTFLWNSDMCSVHWWKCCVFWIGGNDLAVEGTYVWTSDNSTLGFVNWAPGQPDSFYRNVSNCISLCSNELWIGDYCGNYQQYICKTPEM
ncbi:perlucin-like protein isoform X3 [Crassostrea virginica]